MVDITAQPLPIWAIFQPELAETFHYMNELNETSEWLGATFEWEGLPLALRVRPAIDQPVNVKKYPHLGILTHKLAKVRSDGMPLPEYNHTLTDFDHAIHEELEHNGNGLIMIVETFGGNRTYYACIADIQTQKQWIAQITDDFPKHELVGDYDLDAAWQFYRRYRTDFKW